MNVMTKTEQGLLTAVEGLLEQIEALRMQNLVQASAYAALVRHLSAQKLANPATLERDLRALGATQREAGWQEGHELLAGLVAQVAGLPSLQR